MTQKTVKTLARSAGDDVVLSVELEFDYVDNTYGKRGDYPEYDPIIHVYFSRDISPVQVHVTVDTRSAKKAEGSDSVSKALRPGTLYARVKPGLRDCRENLSASCICFCVLARTSVRSESEGVSASYSSDSILTPIGCGQIRIKDIIRAVGKDSVRGTETSTHEKIEVIMRDPTNAGEAKGTALVNIIRLNTRPDILKRVMKKRGENDCIGFYSKDSAKAIDRMEGEFFKTFRSDLSPSDPSIGIYQVPFFSASAAAVPSACFLLYTPPDLAFGADTPQVAHLTACLDWALHFNNITRTYFCEAVDRQLVSAGSEVYDSFLVAVKAAWNALCAFAVRVKYTDDHADPQAPLPPAQWPSPSSATEVQVSVNLAGQPTENAMASARNRYKRFRNPKKSRCYNYSSSSSKRDKNSML